MANESENHQVLSLTGGKRTSIYHTISLGKFTIEPPVRVIHVETMGDFSGMSIPMGFGGATPTTFETFQTITNFYWNNVTGEIVIEVGSGEMMGGNKPVIAISTSFDQDLILQWDKTTSTYITTDLQWTIDVANQISITGPDVPYAVLQVSDCFLTVGGRNEQAWNLNGALLEYCDLFMETP